MKNATKYLNALTNGRTNGFGFIDMLNDEQIAVCCKTANKLVQEQVVSRHDLKMFTMTYTKENPDQQLFDTYITNLLKAEELLESLED